MSPSSVQLAIAGYTIGAVVFCAFAAQLATRRSLATPARMLLAAVIATAAWEVSSVAALLGAGSGTFAFNQLLDCARFGVWIALILTALPAQAGGDPARVRLARQAGGPVAAALLAAAWLGSSSWQHGSHGTQYAVPALALGMSLAAAILGLVLCEWLYRSTPRARRANIKPLVIGVGFIFAFDLFLFADGLLLRALNPELLGARGLVHAFAVPLLAVASARNRTWTADIAVSRSIVFGSTALLLSGAYLLLVAGAGYLARHFGGSWGPTAQVTLLSAAMLAFVVLVASGAVRAYLRVWVSKNFFSYRYDYRTQWLRFTQALSEPGDGTESVGERAIEALAALVESPGGLLWWRDGRDSFRVTNRRNAPALDALERSDGPLASFLEKNGWIADLSDTNRPPGRHEPLATPQWVHQVPEAWLIVPLLLQGRLAGFVVLLRSRTSVELDWEVLDLLKTAARQAAAFLGHVEATEALVQARQFDAFNRVSAFLVHDLKNLVAQQSLLLKNAERHAGNPLFQKDMINTVHHVVERMNRLLLQLRSGTIPVTHPGPVDVGTIADRLVRYHAKQGHRVRLRARPPGRRALAHEDRLERVLGHLIQNAIEASLEAGTDAPVEVRLGADGDAVVVEVEDHGIGMSREFVSEGLFKPFVSGKSAGMGIGAYESREYVREIGGRIDVESRRGEGTVFRVRLPLVDASEQRAA